MSLLRLPPEIVLSIFRLLGSAFFRRDVRRLLVSKWWYELAWPVFLQDVKFRAGSLERFILASKSVDLLHLIRKNVRTVKLVLNGFEEWHFILSASNAAGSTDIDLHAVDIWTSK
ncbi:hypothetical protein E4U44_006631, partial [Claviceps purpurea]